MGTHPSSRHTNGLDADSFALLMRSIERYVHERLMPLEREVEEHDAVPEAVVQEMRELGCFGLSIAPAFGGSGLSTEQQALFQMTLSLTSPAFRAVYSSNMGIGSRAIQLDGTPAQQARYLPRMATGEIVGAFALTEPQAGSDAASLRTRARREGDHYVLDGTKRYISNATRADVFTVMARTNPDAPGAAGISAFLVERGTPGLSIGRPERKMGQHGAPVADVILDQVRVPADQLLGGIEGQGFRSAMKTLDHGRVNIAAMAVGMAQRLLDEALAYAESRHQFGRPIADFQLVQAMLADSQVEIQAARAMTLDTARRLDAGRPAAMEAAGAKLFASEMVCRVADRAVQVFGGAGYIADYPVERMYRDARLLRLYEGTSQILQLVIAKSLRRQQQEGRGREV